jgi:hypothetical protein
MVGLEVRHVETLAIVALHEPEGEFLALHASLDDPHGGSTMDLGPISLKQLQLLAN